MLIVCESGLKVVGETLKELIEAVDALAEIACVSIIVNPKTIRAPKAPIRLSESAFVLYILK